MSKVGGRRAGPRGSLFLGRDAAESHRGFAELGTSEGEAQGAPGKIRL
jgi:hypothetical protein